mgnify:CR=1 FL=1
MVTKELVQEVSGLLGTTEFTATLCPKRLAGSAKKLKSKETKSTCRVIVDWVRSSKLL